MTERIVTLERDLAAAQADVREHISLCLAANKLIDEARAEAAALRVDAERLNSRMIQMHSRDGNEWVLEIFTDIDLRAAIDAAIDAARSVE